MAEPGPTTPPAPVTTTAARIEVLPDGASSKDLFGSHQPVASAIATLIRNGATAGHSIALIGSWGSGKSSVIEMLRGCLHDRAASDFQPHLFLFDAWAHYGDPIRRAFLERLIDFADHVESAGGDTSSEPGAKAEPAMRERWTQDLDFITGRREKSEATADRPLTNLGLLLAVALIFCLPLGGALAGKFDHLHFRWTWGYGAASLTFFLAPVVLAALAWRKQRTIDALKAMLLREARQDTVTTTIRTREPSSIDFQKVFATIVAHALRRPDRRLVVVIDNLDRIDGESAVSMWATMRVFFELDPAANPWLDRFWLIVPFDRSALRGLWRSDDAATAESFVDSFLNKTFQITFHVSPPVLTKWKTYFSDRLRDVFPDDALAAERAVVYSVYALAGRPSPSPREIKLFINKLSALYLQWSAMPEAERIELPFLAAYVLVQSRLQEDATTLLRPGTLREGVVNLLRRYKPAADCREKLAAAHFNVPPSEAIQVLLVPRILSGFATGAMSELDDLQRSPYFWHVFERVAPDQHGEWVENPAVLANVVNFLDKVQPADAEAASTVSRIWAVVMDTTRAVGNWGDLDQARAAAFRVILARAAADPRDLEPIATAMITHLTAQVRRFNTELSASQQEVLGPWARSAYDALTEIRRYPTTNALVDSFKIAAAPHLFVALALAALRQDSAKLLLPHFSCASPESIPLTLSALLPITSEDEFLALKAALEPTVPKGWDEFDSKVIAALPTLPVEKVVTGVRVMLGPRAGRVVSENVLEAIVPTALAKLSEPEDQKRWAEAGVLAAVTLLAPAPNDLSERHAATVSRLRTAALDPDLVVAVADAILGFDCASRLLEPEAAQRFGPNRDAVLTAILDKGGFDRLDPRAVTRAFQSVGVELGQRLARAAAGSEAFRAHVTRRGEPPASDEYGFLGAWLTALDGVAREEAALGLVPVLQSETPETVPPRLLDAVCSAWGSAWLQLDAASEWLTILSPRVNLFGATFTARLSQHFRDRIEMGDRAVVQLLEQAERGAPPERSRLQELAIDRARGDYALAAGDRYDELVAWGRALLVRGRRGPWATVTALAERAEQVFERAHRLRPSPETAAGLAEALQQRSRPLPDSEALPLLDRAFEIIPAVIQVPGLPDTVSPGEGRHDTVRVAEALVLLSRATRIDSAQQRMDDLGEAERALVFIPEERRSEWAWTILARCLTAAARVHVPADESRLAQAEGGCARIVGRNPNSVDALRHLALLRIIRAENKPWDEAEALLREAQQGLDEVRSADPDDYFAMVSSGDVQLRFAARRPREQVSELATRAREHYSAAAQLDDTRPEAFVGLAWTAVLLARRAARATSTDWVNTAVGAAQNALTRRRDSAPAWRVLGNAQRRAAECAPRAESRKMFDEALKSFERGAGFRADDYAILTDWAFAHLAAARGERADARLALTAALEKAEAALRLEPSFAHARVARGEALLRGSDFVQAERRTTLLQSAHEEFETALETAADLESALTGWAATTLHLAEARSVDDRESELAAAEDRVNRALALRSDNEEALETLGDVRWRRALDKRDDAGAFEAAREAYDRARQIEPDRHHSVLRVADVDVQLARILRAADRLDQAIEEYRAAISQFPERAGGYAGLGSALEQGVSSKLRADDPIGALQESVGAFRQAASLRPTNVEVYRSWKTALLELVELLPSKRDELLKEVSRLDDTIARLTSAGTT